MSRMLGNNTLERSIELRDQNGNLVVSEVGSSAIKLFSPDKKLIARFGFDAFFIGFIAKLNDGSLALGVICSEVVGGLRNSNQARISDVVVVSLDKIRREVNPDSSGTYYRVSSDYTNRLQATPEQLNQLLGLHQQASEKQLFCSSQQIADVADVLKKNNHRARF